MHSRRVLTTISLAALALAGAGVARAQETAPQNTQSPARLPQTIPGLENYSLPSSNDRLRLPDAPQTPRPSATPTPMPTPTPRATPVIRPTASPPPVMIQPLPTPTPSAAPTRRAPEPRAASTPTPEPTPSALPTSSPTPEPTVPASVPSPTPTPVAGAVPAATPMPEGQGGSLLPIVLALLGIAAAGLAWLLLSRRRAAAREEEPAAEAPAVPVVPPRRIAPAERPQLELAFRPRRAGMNVLSAAVDYELVVRNAGAAPARGVRVALQLFTAGDRHDTEVKQFLDAPVEAPVVAPFDLAPGETRSLRAMAMLPKAAVNVVTVKGRPMFVPMVAINALYQWGDGRDGQTATSHVVGIAKPGVPKMQPFWLDAPPRMYDGVGEHAHAIALRR